MCVFHSGDTLPLRLTLFCFCFVYVSISPSEENRRDGQHVTRQTVVQPKPFPVFGWSLVTRSVRCRFSLPDLVAASHFYFVFSLVPHCGGVYRFSESNFKCYDGVTVGLT